MMNESVFQSHGVDDNEKTGGVDSVSVTVLNTVQ